MPEWKYCVYCGGALSEHWSEAFVRYACGGCKEILYRNPAPAAGCVVESDGRILLVRRKLSPYAAQWCLPSGFLEYEEAIEDAAVREVAEETGLVVQLTGIFGVYSTFDDPRKNGLLVLYSAKVTGGILAPGTDASEAEFFGPQEVPQSVAFAAHRKAVEAWRIGALDLVRQPESRG